MDAIKDILKGVFEQLQTPEKTIRGKLVNHWQEIVGEKIAAHTKPLLTEDRKLIVWVDQSTLAFELRQRYQTSLLKRTQALLGQEAVREIKFYVGQIR